jgi:two-component system sensor histidine kinase VicK
MRPLFEARRITLETCVISDGDVLADRDWVQQALRVVLDNAAKYTEPGGSVVFETTREREHIAFAVRDTGQGIPPDQLPRVFERFYRVDSSRSREHGGAGLGLAIARGIIEMHGGSIVIESQLGVGTTVTIKLPAASGQRDSAGEAAPAPQDDPP